MYIRKTVISGSVMEVKNIIQAATTRKGYGQRKEKPTSEQYAEGQ